MKPGHTLVVNPSKKKDKEMSRRNPGAKDLAMTAGEALGLGAIAAGADMLIQKLSVANSAGKVMLKKHAPGITQIAVGVVAGLAVDQFAGRRDVAVGLATGFTALGFRREWAYMRPAAYGTAAGLPAGTYSQGLPAGNSTQGTPANAYAAYYRG